MLGQVVRGGLTADSVLASRYSIVAWSDSQCLDVSTDAFHLANTSRQNDLPEARYLLGDPRWLRGYFWPDETTFLGQHGSGMRLEIRLKMRLLFLVEPVSCFRS